MQVLPSGERYRPRAVVPVRYPPRARSELTVRPPVTAGCSEKDGTDDTATYGRASYPVAADLA